MPALGERIFEPFSQGEGRSRGLGLGLFIVREIVRAHGGTIAMRSGRRGRRVHGQAPPQRGGHNGRTRHVLTNRCPLTTCDSCPIETAALVLPRVIGIQIDVQARDPVADELEHVAEATAWSLPADPLGPRELALRGALDDNVVTLERVVVMAEILEQASATGSPPPRHGESTTLAAAVVGTPADCRPAGTYVGATRSRSTSSVRSSAASLLTRSAVEDPPEGTRICADNASISTMPSSAACSVASVTRSGAGRRAAMRCSWSNSRATRGRLARSDTKTSTLCFVIAHPHSSRAHSGVMRDTSGCLRRSNPMAIDHPSSSVLRPCRSMQRTRRRGSRYASAPRARARRQAQRSKVRPACSTSRRADGATVWPSPDRTFSRTCRRAHAGFPAPAVARHRSPRSSARLLGDRHVNLPGFPARIGRPIIRKLEIHCERTPWSTSCYERVPWQRPKARHRTR